jgi:hypothetical protein
MCTPVTYKVHIHVNPKSIVSATLHQISVRKRVSKGTVTKRAVHAIHYETVL